MDDTNDDIKDYLQGFDVQRYHRTDDGFVVETIQDIDHILKSNQEMANANSLSSRYVHKDTALGVQVGSIPMVKIHELMKKFQKERGLERPPGVSNPEFKTYLFAWISDPENRKFRVDGRTYRMGKQNG